MAISKGYSAYYQLTKAVSDIRKKIYVIRSKAIYALDKINFGDDINKIYILPVALSHVSVIC